MDARALKDKAAEAFTKGRFAKAAELWGQYCKADPRDLQARLRLGDAWAKAGKRPEAIDAYKGAAEAFARAGFLPRAIAASKLILELDPRHQGVQQMLADLYAQRGTPAPRAPTRELEALTGTGRHAPIELAPEPAPPPAPRAIAPPPAPPAALDRRGGGPIDLSAELPPELAVITPLPPEPLAPPQALELELMADDTATDDDGVEIPLEVEDGAPDAALPAVQGVVLEPEPPEGLVVEEGDDDGGGITLELSDVEARAEPPAPAALPPGLRPRQAPPPAPMAAAASSFTELELDGDSLLHAVELAAQAAPSASVDLALEEPAESEPAQGAEALPHIPLFSDLPRDAFIALFERCPLRRFGPGERVVQQGRRGDAFYVICEGEVRVVVKDAEPGAGEREIARLQAGAFFGEMALLSDAPRSASVDAAAEDTQLLEISAPVLAELSRSSPGVAQALRKFCRQRMLSNVMNTSPLFRPFDRKDRKDLVERFRAREVPAGQVVIREGAATDGLYVLLSGEVAVTREGQALATLRGGDIFGEISLLQKSPASATVTATRRTSLLRLPREDFDALIMSHPQVLVLVSELSEERLRRSEAVLGGVAVEGEEGLMLV